MFNRLLIANRGEIACRIARTAKRLGIKTIAIYSDADRNALHVEQADGAAYVGGAAAAESYLSIESIIAAAKATGADAVHPGYGFLAESPEFAEACTAVSLVFVGPPPKAMRQLGDKASAKALASERGVSIVPGYAGAKQSANDLLGEAERIGFPVLIKAVAGGGGRGMRVVHGKTDFNAALASAKREAKASFGDDRIILEKLIASPRHIEVQVFADSHGNVVHMFERECTLQRRHQKVIEEAPAAGMTTGLRKKLTAAATALAKAANYEGAGTVEFLIEGGRLNEAATWYFIEMNTRLQVEHPVTEEITGLDLVEWQLRIAAGQKLPLTQSNIVCDGHAIEARLCAEDPSNGFRPEAGPIVSWREPNPNSEGERVRIDSGFGAGREISPHYDSLIAKLICHGPTRQAAINSTAHAFTRFAVAGPKTNAQFLHRLLSAPEFVSEKIDTGFIDRNLDRLTRRDPDPIAIAAGAAALLAARCSEHDARWADRSGFQMGGGRSVTYRFAADGEPTKVIAQWGGDGMALSVSGEPVDSADIARPDVYLSGGRAYVINELTQTIVTWPDYTVATDDLDAGNRISAPITGRIAAVAVSAGDKVIKGETIAVVEAMKMEHIVKAGREGTIAAVQVAPGDQVSTGQTIATTDGDDRG